LVSTTQRRDNKRRDSLSKVGIEEKERLNMSVKKVKINLNPGESYVIANMSTWEDLSYTIKEVANQHEYESEAYLLWMQYADFFESQYTTNAVQEDYDEDDGWI